MSAPVLTLSEQKAAMSGKKKKKKTIKNILSIPSQLCVESHPLEVNETEKLGKILERLLPTASLPAKEKCKSNQDSKKRTFNESQLKTETQSKRNQLSLGVNALSRSIKKELISAVLIASDIQPKFLIHHLNLLCSHNNIPFLHMPGLRIITKNTLGFPCIALGFKKNSDFIEAVEEIRSVSEAKKFVTSNSSQETKVESSDNEQSEEEINENPVNSDETPFTHLMRTSNKERVFIPERCNNEKTKSPTEFLTLAEDDSEKNVSSKPSQLGISSNLIRKRKKKLISVKKVKRAAMDEDEDDGDDDDDDYEDLEMPEKKIKKDWVMDKVGERKNYYPTSLMRVPSNSNRSRRD